MAVDIFTIRRSPKGIRPRASTDGDHLEWYWYEQSYHCMDAPDFIPAGCTTSHGTSIFGKEIWRELPNPTREHHE